MERSGRLALAIVLNKGVRWLMFALHRGEEISFALPAQSVATAAGQPLNNSILQKGFKWKV
ncbi:hypothetical protein Sjap_022838 [Stephania japonica]|uniref:Uncharacterized protein n=1 Tax=Stephania japonica TaxID=461633 RepID=A0AAP0EPN2_9MAGN